MKSRFSDYFKAFFYKNSESVKDNVHLNTNNPYIAARQEWNFMFADILKAKYNWQCIGFILGIINILLVIGIITIALQARFIPYAVKVDNLGNSDFAGLLTKQGEISPLMINSILRRYIIQARSVIADPVAQKHQLDFVYHCTHGEAKLILDAFYKVQNPFNIAKDETVDVTINSVLATSINTWQVHWTEIHRDTVGHINLENHFEGLVKIEQKTPSTMEDININPLGLYITYLSWSAQQ
jgi:type IV secretory pathway TrbF-like protein